MSSRHPKPESEFAPQPSLLTFCVVISLFGSFLWGMAASVRGLDATLLWPLLVFGVPLGWLLARTGDSVAWLLVMALTWTRWRELSVALLWTVAITAVLVYLAKNYFKRERPSDPHRGLGADKFSFPSGHAARVTAVAITLSFLFPLWTVAFLLWGTAVALSRVALARHFFSDVIGGTLVGLVVSLLLQLFR